MQQLMHSAGWRMHAARAVNRLAAVFCGAAMLAAASWANAQVAEYDMKAAFVFNFAVFTAPVAPPAAPAPPGEFVVCVFGRDPFGASIKALEAKTIDKRPVVVRNVAQPEALSGCALVFFGETAAAPLAAALKSVAGKPVITVGDEAAFPNAGFVFNLSLDRQRVVFDVSQESARAQGLQVSANLLRVARSVQAAVVR
jgi:YfiR/HmsC-like